MNTISFRRTMSRTRSIVAMLLCMMPIAVSAQTTVKYVHTDALGSVVAMTDASGNTVEARREYEPYGYQTTPAIQDGPGYTGHVQDAATSLTYMQQRYYDPQLGLFLSVDPVTAHSSPVAMFNRYRYADNNPYRYYDPDGRCTGSRIVNDDGTCRSSGGMTTQSFPTNRPQMNLFADGHQAQNPWSNPTGGNVRGCDRHGCGHDGAPRGARRHKGADYEATPGDDVRSPVSGTVVRQSNPYADDPRYKGLLIKTQDGTLVQVWYINPTDRIIGKQVRSGQIIGTAQDLTIKYDRNMTNHVHVRVTGPSGTNIDPESVIPEPYR